MGQEEIVNLLKQFEGQWFSAKQISKLLGLSIYSITDSLMRLRRWKEVKYKPNLLSKGGKGGFGYLYSSR